MKTILAVLALLAMPVAFASEPLQIKGVSLDDAVGELSLIAPSLECAPPAAGAIFSTCATNGEVTGDLATYGGVPVEVFGAHADGDDLVAIVLLLRAPDAQAGTRLHAALVSKYGAAKAEPENTRATFKWESGGRRLTLGADGSGRLLITLWELPAWNRMVEARKKQLATDI